MHNQSEGLRFDVYERVHIADGVAAISELEEIELTPHIQVAYQDDQVLLRGKLLLHGLYNSEETGNVQSLEHWIPVEITLPMNRVNRIEDISVEIDNFDVDLLSARTLNVTGLLSLRGLRVLPAQTEEAWQEEPFTVVHRAGRQPSQEQLWVQPQAQVNQHVDRLERAEEQLSPPVQDQGELLQQSVESWQESASGPDVVEEWTPELSEQDAETNVTVEWTPEERPEQHLEELQPNQWSGYVPYPAAVPQVQEAPAVQEFAAWPGFNAGDEREEVAPEASENLASSAAPEAETAAIPSVTEQHAAVQWLPETASAEVTPEADPEPEALLVQQSTVQPEALSPAEESSQEVKIAFSGKQEKGDEEGGSVGLLTLLQSNRREQEARNLAKQQERQAEEAAAEAAAPLSGDEVEWKRLFVNKSDDTEFRKLRMCIVQREDTLEGIADRYQLNPRELVLYNRLSDSTVLQGQVLYIP
ncbi:LysM peptidoglycan-binding domain-containing protein [Paenibacillaceae bacterium]|nr:LysM peptidoglycan-binding domain-containing protein [Paenibacillaceae bacterium]